MTMKLTNAITRKPGKNFAEGLTTAKLGQPDYQLILKQHAAYVEALKVIGLEVVSSIPSRIIRMRILWKIPPW
jgi:hypothetical protein